MICDRFFCTATLLRCGLFQIQVYWAEYSDLGHLFTWSVFLNCSILIIIIKKKPVSMILMSCDRSTIKCV